MKIKTLELQNFRRFEQASIAFPDNNLVVFMGNNGEGKSSILDALGMLLVWAVNPRLYDRKNYPIFERHKPFTYDINKKSSVAYTTVTLEFDKELYGWGMRLVNEHDKTKASREDNNNSFRNYVDAVKGKMDKDHYTSIPVLMYYRSDREVDKFYWLRENRREYSHSQLEANEQSFDFRRTDFDNFLIWYRLQEDIESEQMRAKNDFSLLNPKLEAVRQSLKIFFNALHENSYQNLRAKREDNASTLIISKNGEDFSLAQLSDGEKMLLAMVGDTARRLAIANPLLSEKAYEGEGVVLIDEIELHLHPKWQRLVLPALQATFPNVQFIVTTHSPQVLGGVKAESVFIVVENGIFHPSTNPLGRDSNSILEQVMGTTKSSKEAQDGKEKYLHLIQNNKLEEANELKKNLLTRDIVNLQDPVFTQADAIIFKKQLLNS